MNKAVLHLAFSQRRHLTGSLLDIAFSQPPIVSGAILDVSFASQERVSGKMLELSFAQELLQKRRFLGEEAIGVGDYDIAVYVGGTRVNMCKLAESMTIRHGENESYTCDFVMQENKGGQPKPINLYEWYGQSITVQLIHDDGVMRIFGGIVNSVQADFLGGKTRVGCTDRRERLLDTVDDATIKNIGITSKSAHGDFLNKADEITKRLETVPASFEFDVYGHGRLVSWLAGTSTRTIDDCMIYYRQPTLRLAEVGQVVNEVEIKLTRHYQRLRQRNIYYQMNLGINVCQYAAYGKLPTLRAIAAAAEQTGWTLGGFNFERSFRSGWVNCGGTKLGNVRAKSDTTVVSGVFELAKRWVQPIGETYNLVVRNDASISRYGKLSESLGYAVTAENDIGDWISDIPNAHRDGPSYQLATGDYFVSPFLSRPTYKKWDLANAPNGDYYINLNDTDGDFEKTYDVALATARTKILASHRQNTLDLEIKFLPEVSLTHSHEINHTFFKGTLKVASFTHTFDFIFGTGQTAIQYKFFQGDSSGGIASFNKPSFDMPANWVPYSKELWLGRVELEPEQNVDNLWGMIYRKAVVSHRTQLYTPVAFRVRVPEVETQSTDSADQSKKISMGIGVPHTNIEVYL